MRRAKKCYKEYLNTLRITEMVVLKLNPRLNINQFMEKESKH